MATRAAIRQLKRTARAGAQSDAGEDTLQAARDAALTLLQRSVAMHHDRLALLRLADAQRLGVTVDARSLAYCAAITSPRPRTGRTP